MNSMPPSLRLARNNLAGKRVRTLLMAFAVAAASSLVIMVACAMATIQASVERSLTRFLGASDARIIHPAGSRIDASLLELARSWEEVDEAIGRTRLAIKIAHADAEAAAESETPSGLLCNAIATNLDQLDRFQSIDIGSGRWPESPEEILVDPLTAERMNLAPGDRVVVDGADGAPELTVAGVYVRRKLGVLQQPRLYVDLSVAGRLSDDAASLTSVLIILNEGVDTEEFCAAHKEEVASPLELEPAELVRSGFDRRLHASRLALILTAVLTFICAGFIIVTGLTTGVTERQRELAILRCIGASKRQLFTAQLLVGLFFGVAGAAVGIPFGLLITHAIVTHFKDAIVVPMHISGLGFMLTVAGALGTGIIGALYPAFHASRIPPLQAMTRQAQPIRARSVIICLAFALGCIGAQMLLSAPADRDVRFWAYMTTGLPLLCIGYFLLSVPLLYAVAGAFGGALTGLFRLPRGMLSGSVLSTPFRHGLTAGALMVSMALLVDTWSCGVSLLDDWLGEIRFADGFAMRLTGLKPEHVEAIEGLEFVEEVCPISSLQVKLADRQVFGVEGITPPYVMCIGFDPERFFRMNEIEWVQGEQERAIERLTAGEGAIVAERFLTAQNIGVGDTLTMELGRVSAEVEIVGVVRSSGLDIITQVFGIRSVYREFAISCVFMDYDTAANLFSNHDAYMLQVDLDDSVTDDEATEAINATAPGVMFRSGRWIMETLNDVAGGLLAAQSAMAFAALSLSCLAVANVIAANIQGRRFEYGVLRAAGANRRLLVRIIVAEALLIALTAVVVGVLFGFHLAWMDVRFMRDLAGLPVRVAVPLTPIATGAAVLVGMTLLAALPSALGLIRRPITTMIAGGRGG
jgi:putative ABC transport system permease protein